MWRTLRRMRPLDNPTIPIPATGSLILSPIYTDSTLRVSYIMNQILSKVIVYVVIQLIYQMLRLSQFAIIIVITFTKGSSVGNSFGDSLTVDLLVNRYFTRFCSYSLGACSGLATQQMGPWRLLQCWHSLEPDC